MVAAAVSRKEIQENWEWLDRNLMSTLGSFDGDEDIHTFVKVKIESLVAQAPETELHGTPLSALNPSYSSIRFQTKTSPRTAP